MWEEEKSKTMSTDVCNLIVMKTSVFFAGDGFTVYDSNCQVVFRVDSYGGPDGHYRDELYLMDGAGNCLLTLRRKRPSLHQRWEGYAGEGLGGSKDSKPIFSIKRSSMIGRSTVTVETYSSSTDPETFEYLIDGSFTQRSCTFYELGGGENGCSDGNGRSVMAEIRRKVDVSTTVMMGKDVFEFNIIKPGFDPTFAMGIVLVLDQISDDDNNVGNLEEQV